MLTAIALDDEPPALAVIESFCANTESIILQRTFTRPSEAREYLNENPVDLLFLDIHMPSIHGIEFYKTLQQNILVIFTTAHIEYALDGFNLQAIDYLLKPYTYERFAQAIRKAQEISTVKKLVSPTDAYLSIKADYCLHRIPMAEISFIESLDDYLKIHTLNTTKPLVARMTMRSLQEKLPVREFIRVHRSFIVAWKSIEKVRNRIIYIGTKEIPLGLTYEENFWKHYT